MGYQRPRAVLTGLTAVAGAFGVATIISAANAPTAHADDFTDILSAVQNDLAVGHDDFTNAFNDFGNSTEPAGLEAYLSGVTNDLILPGDQEFVGAVDAVTNQSIYDLPVLNFGFGDYGVPNITTSPTDLTTALTDAQTAIADAQTYFADAASALSTGDYADAALLDVVGSYASFDLPVDLLVLGGAEQLLGF
jgi:hypothetical protein